MKIMSIVGARPNFIKLGPMSKALCRTADGVIVHTGQHYDREMSALLFEEMGIPEPEYNLGVSGGSVSEQTAAMLVGISGILAKEKPDLTVVFGDTTSTLAGALASLQAKIPCAHIEAGPRNRSMLMNELVNRVIADRISTLLFCATRGNLETLRLEGLGARAHFVGDHMLDAMVQYLPLAETRSDILKDAGVSPGGYHLATCHRAETTDIRERLAGVIGGLGGSDKPVLFPVHPRTDKMLRHFGLDKAVKSSDKIIPLGPVGYLESLLLCSKACKVVTDSGGVQREAFFAGKPCVVIFDESSWPEIEQAEWQTVTGPDAAAISGAIRGFATPNSPQPHIFGDGHASEKTMDVINGFDIGNWDKV